MRWLGGCPPRVATCLAARWKHWLWRATLTLYQLSEMLGLSRVETEDFLGRHNVPLSVMEESDLDREAAVLDAASRRKPL
jgi:hypothetical protein